MTPQATSSSLIGIVRSERAYVAVGAWGHIVRSTDQGRTWSQSSVPLSSDLVAASFPTTEKGWAVGHDGVILHTEDGGKTWERQLDGRKVGDVIANYYESRLEAGDSGFAKVLAEARTFKAEGPSKPFLDVYFENEQSGWVIGPFNLILHTSDGGKNWEPWIDRSENEAGSSLHAIGRAGDELFMVGDLGYIRRLDRQKKRFITVASPYAGSLFGVVGKPGMVFVFGLRGNIFRSSNNGATWQSLRQDMDAALVGGTFLDDGRLVLVSNAGDVLLSKDDGNTFTRVPVASKVPLSAVAPLDENSVIVVGTRGVRRQVIK
jgi:photosystem II stability/assembly factor-like uncharacterized protein